MRDILETWQNLAERYFSLRIDHGYNEVSACVVETLLSGHSSCSLCDESALGHRLSCILCIIIKATTIRYNYSKW